jgi:hypothetical protein
MFNPIEAALLLIEQKITVAIKPKTAKLYMFELLDNLKHHDHYIALMQSDTSVYIPVTFTHRIETGVLDLFDTETVLVLLAREFTYFREHPTPEQWAQGRGLELTPDLRDKFITLVRENEQLQQFFGKAYDQFLALAIIPGFFISPRKQIVF